MQVKILSKSKIQIKHLVKLSSVAIHRLFKMKIVEDIPIKFFFVRKKIQLLLVAQSNDEKVKVNANDYYINVFFRC